MGETSVGESTLDLAIAEGIAPKKHGVQESPCVGVTPARHDSMQLAGDALADAIAQVRG
jgi:hypothetical protein